MKGKSRTIGKRMTFAIVLFLSLLSVSAYPFSATQSDTNPTSIRLGSNIIDIKDVNFVCENQPRIVSPRFHGRFSPEGNYEQNCICTQTSKDSDNYGACIKDSCTVTKDEKNNPSCWLLDVNNFNSESKLQFNKNTKINQYINETYTTNAQLRYLSQKNAEAPYIEDYNVNLDLNIDMSGLTVNAKPKNISSTNQELEITYTNNILDGLEGFIEVKQEQLLFLPASTVQTIPVTFKSGSDSFTIKLNSIIGEKTIYIVPAITVKQVQGEKIIKSSNIEGKIIEYSTKVAKQRSTIGTEAYLPEKQPSYNFISSFTAWINSLFA